MDGPLSVAMAHLIFKGHFRTTPLAFGGKPSLKDLCLIQHHSKEDHLGFLTNAWIDSSMGITKFYSTAHAADFVSKTQTHYLNPPPSHTDATHYYTVVIQSFITLSTYAVEAWAHTIPVC